MKAQDGQEGKGWIGRHRIESKVQDAYDGIEWIGRSMLDKKVLDACKGIGCIFIGRYNIDRRYRKVYRMNSEQEGIGRI